MRRAFMQAINRPRRRRAKSRANRDCSNSHHRRLRHESLEGRLLLSIAIGDTVRVTGGLNVRTGPGVGYNEIVDPDYVEYAPTGTIGEVLDGPVTDAYTWWRIDYGPGLYYGWSVDAGLENVDPQHEQLLTVPHVHQTYDTPDDFVGSWACAPTSAVMMLAYYGRISPNPIWASYPSPGHSSDYGHYVSREYAYGGYTFSHEHTEYTSCGTATGKGAWGYIWQDEVSGVRTHLEQYIELHDLDVAFHENPSEAEARTLVQQQIDDGRPLIARTKLTDGGHYVVVIGYEIAADGSFWYKANDPFGHAHYQANCWGNYNVPQPVYYTYAQMRLDDWGRGLFVIEETSVPEPDLYDDGDDWSNFSPETVFPGDSWSVWCDVRNGGDGDAGGFYVDYYASANTTITTSDYYLGRDWISGIAAGSYEGAQLDVSSFSSSIPVGDYWVGWIIDADDDVLETNESNNTAYNGEYQLLVRLDDHYEPNDSLETAYDLSSYEQTWLSTLDGTGIQGDEDWYRIEVTPGCERLVVDLVFFHADGNIDLEVRSASGGFVTASTTTNDNEHIDHLLPGSGTYYLRVFGANNSNEYNLWWDGAGLVIVESGDFVDEVQRLKGLIFSKDSNLYVAPNATQRADFSTMATMVLADDLLGAASIAAMLDYEIVDFTDTTTGEVFRGLREELVGGSQTRGWGSYFLNLSHAADALIEVPHPLFDINSWEVGAKVVLEADARAFLMAGAHRHANGTGTADVAHLSNSVFQEVHEAWNGTTAENIPWQIHGFDLDNHTTFPAGTDAVFSNGDGSISTEVVRLDQQFEAVPREFLAYSYNTLDANDPVNIQVNDGEPGSTFSSLAATGNVQGIYSRSAGGTFVHVELEQSIRFDAGKRDLAASAIAAAIPEAPPTLSINDVSRTEGHGGTTNFNFTVSLSQTSSQAVTVQYATANGTAVAPGDYTAKSGTLTIPAGQINRTISVSVKGDTIIEPDETFYVNLSNPSGATIVDGQGLGTIVNDDDLPLPMLSINDVSLTEGDSGAKNFTFTVSLSQTNTQDVTVQYDTADGTATAPSDYISTSSTLTIPAGETSRTISVPVNGDTDVEPDETFYVNLSNPSGATIVDGQGLGTIVNDDNTPIPGFDWSTYLGGSGYDNGYGIAVDGAGNTYVTGYTSSSGWVSGGYDLSLDGDYDAFVVKLSSDGVHLWSTYLGGSSDDNGYGIAVDGIGNVYVTGETCSSGWVSGDSYNGGASDAFVVKLSSDGEYLWSTYLGGSSGDYGYGIAVDGTGNAYVTGVTASSGWVSGGYCISYNGGYNDAFVVKLSSDGMHLWSTYLGGSSGDYGHGIAVDGAGNAYVTGNTMSSGWVSGGYDIIFDGGHDAFVAKLSSDGAHLLWSTYLGGSDYDSGRGIAVDGAGNAYVTGTTTSSGWVSEGYSTTHNGDYDAFAAKLSSDGMHLWSTYLGGSDYDEGNDIAVDGAGNVYVTGETYSSGWVSGGHDTIYKGDRDAFVAKLSSNGAHLWSTYLGGSDGDIAEGIAVNGNGNVYVSGRTGSSGWVSEGHDITYNGGGDAFVVRFKSIPGDANWDRIVNDQDASIMAAHWQQTEMDWTDGDFNGDGVVNDEDASILAAHWQEGAEGEAAALPDEPKDELARALPRKRALARPSEPEQQSPVEEEAALPDRSMAKPVGVPADKQDPAQRAGRGRLAGGEDGLLGKQHRRKARIVERAVNCDRPPVHDVVLAKEPDRVDRMLAQLAWSLESDWTSAGSSSTKDTRAERAVDYVLRYYWA